MKNHQSTINKCLRANARYERLNDLRNIAEDNDDEKSVRKLNRQCEDAFDRYLTYLQELPKYIQNQITKSI